MDASTVDYTARIPTELFYEIIERVEDRNDRYAVIHVCTRWRQIAFAHQRRYCWFNCEYQNIWQLSSKAHKDLCYAQLRCRADHKKQVDISLQNMSADAIEITLGLLDQNMERLKTLTLRWSGASVGSRIFAILSRQPSPSLESLTLQDRRQGGESYTRIPSDIFAGSIPPLLALSITSIALPGAPLKQFASVRTLTISGNVHATATLALDDIVLHFPATTTATFGTEIAIQVDGPTTPRCADWLTRLQQLTAKETVISALLDARPNQNALPHISVSQELFGVPGVLAEHTPSRLLVPMKESTKDVRLQVMVRFYRNTGRFDLHFTAHHPGVDNSVQRTFSVSPELLTCADPLKALHITRLEIDHRAFAVVWPLLAPDALQGVRLIIGATLSDSKWPVMPAMRQLVLAHRQSGFATTRSCISARSLVSFVRATFALDPTSPRFRLRLDNVDVEGSMRSVERMFEEWVNGPCSSWNWLNSHGSL